MNVYRLRGPLSWGHKSGRHSKNHSSLAGGISISRGFAAKTHSTATQYCQLRRLETTGHPDLKYNEKWVFRCSFSISTYPWKKRKAIINLIWFYFSGAFCIIVSVGLLYRKCDVWATLVWKKKHIKTNWTKQKQDKRICFLLSVSFVFSSKVYSFPESLIVVLIPYSKITRSAIPTNKVVNKQMIIISILTRKNRI